MNPTAAILDSISELIVHHDPEMRVLWANKAVSDLVGLAPEELVGRYCYETWPRRSEPCVGCPVTKARETGQAQEKEMITPDGRAWFIRGYPVRDINGKLTGTVEIALEISERKLAEAEIEKRNRELASLAAITASIMQSTLDLDEVLQRVADGVVKGLGCNTAFIFLLDEREGVFKGGAVSTKNKILGKLNAVLGFPVLQIKFPARADLNEAVRNILNGRITIKHDLHELVGPILSKRICSAMQGLLNSKTFFAMPLLAKGKVMGGIVASTREELSEADTQKLMTFANQAAVAIENARLYDKMQHQSERLAQTLAITELLHRDLKLEQLLDQIAQGAVGLGFRRAVINVCEPDGELVRVQATAGLEKHEREMLMAATYHWSDFQSLMQERFRVSRSYLIRHGEVDWEKDFRGPVVIPSVENRGPGYWHPEDALFVPLWGIHGQPVGLLSVDEPASGLIPDLVTIQTLEAFANQAAIAIENARLFKQIEERRMYLEGVLKATPDAIVTVDAQDKIVEWNPGSERLFGYSREEAIGHSLNDLVTKPDVYEEGVRFSQILMAGNEVPPVETVRYRKDGSPVHVILAASPIVVREKLMGAVIVYTDITARKQMEDTLRALLLVDELTGLYNRRGFMTLGRQQLKTAHRLKTAVVMLFADFDNLKRINDTFGHPEGDRALIDVAEVLRMTFRESDIIARIGGDEFVVLALQVANESANAITTRLQKNLQAHNTTRHRRYKLSLSVGIAQYDPEHPCSIEELLVRADRAMYDRKREQPSAFDEASGQQRNGNAQPEAMPNNTLKEAK